MFSFIYKVVFLKIFKYPLILLPSQSLMNLFAKYSFEVTSYKLKKYNVTMGEGTIVINSTFSSSTKGDGFYIGDNCTVTGATFLGHDASPTLYFPALVMKDEPYLPGSRASYRSSIKVGNNVFIGHGSIIMPGINVGDNVVVAAGSVVTKNVLSGTVVGGNPAKMIKSIDEYKSKYESLQKEYPERF